MKQENIMPPSASSSNIVATNINVTNNTINNTPSANEIQNFNNFNNYNININNSANTNNTTLPTTSPSMNLSTLITTNMMPNQPTFYNSSGHITNNSNNIPYRGPTVNSNNSSTIYLNRLDNEIAKVENTILSPDLKLLLSDYFFSSIDEFELNLDRINKDLCSINNNNNNNNNVTHGNNNNNRNLVTEEELFNRFLSLLKTRSPTMDTGSSLVNGFYELRNNFYQFISETFKITDFSEIQSLDNLQTEIEQLTNKYSIQFDNLPIPTIMYDRSGTIWHVNNAYKILTGFDFSIPTPKYDNTFYRQILSPNSLLEYFRTVLLFMKRISRENYHISTFMVNCDLKYHLENEKYIPGVLNVSFKRGTLRVKIILLA